MNLSAVLLAGGKGKRMHSATPKVLHKIGGKPLIFYSLNLFDKLPVSDILVVVGYQKAIVKVRVLELANQLEFNKEINFVVQPRMLGTGDAVKRAVASTKNNVTDIIVFNGDDSCFYKPATIKQIIDLHVNSKSDMTFVTLNVSDPIGLGRIVRDAFGKVKGIIEEKAASETQKKISEVNDGCYVFNLRWLKQNINKIKLSPVGEYYLTDLVEIGARDKAKIETFTLDKTNEWVGVNTKEELVRADQLMKLVHEIA